MTFTALSVTYSRSGQNKGIRVMAHYEISRLFANANDRWICDISVHGGDINYETARRKARKAILDEITIREESPTRTAANIAQAIRIEPVASKTDNYSFPKPHTITFREQF